MPRLFFMEPKVDLIDRPIC